MGAEGVLYAHVDQVGAVRALVNQSSDALWRWEGDPFGKSAADQSPGDLTYPFQIRFPGQHFDEESGLHYNYFRDYAPSHGRYAQSDPIGLYGGMNTYTYVESDPVSYADPYGLIRAHLDLICEGLTRIDRRMKDRARENNWELYINNTQAFDEFCNKKIRTECVRACDFTECVLRETRICQKLKNHEWRRYRERAEEIKPRFEALCPSTSSAPRSRRR